nr:immunoglobulin light chain junction region [Macaca mulatta]
DYHCGSFVGSNAWIF